MSARSLALTALVALSAPSLHAANLAVSIGIRETNVAGAIFANGGSVGGIEYVKLDGQTLIADGTWQLFTFTPASDTLTAFAGATANSVLEQGLTHAVLEMIRIRNVDGITQPIRLWIDDVANTVASGPTVEGFETFALGAEAMFQEPRFSGSTAGNLAVAPNTSAVANSMAFNGAQSYQADFQFIDNDVTRWMRYTTFNAANAPNPIVVVREPGAPEPTISFYAKAVVIPEPTASGLACLAALGVLAKRRCRGRRLPVRAPLSA